MLGAIEVVTITKHGVLSKHNRPARCVHRFDRVVRFRPAVKARDTPLFERTRRERPRWVEIALAHDEAALGGSAAFRAKTRVPSHRRGADDVAANSSDENAAGVRVEVRGEGVGRREGM